MVLDRSSNTLVPCTPDRCPYAKWVAAGRGYGTGAGQAQSVEDASGQPSQGTSASSAANGIEFLVNQAPYTAMGGMSAGINKHMDPEHQYVSGVVWAYPEMTLR